MSEQGATPIEFAAGVGLLLIPIVFLVASFAPWVERQSMARVAAAEAARLVATSPTGAVDEAAIGGVVATNFNGPRRYAHGGVRDHVIGIQAIDGRGVARCG